MNIPITDKSQENKRAIADMILVYESKMFLNEKNYTMRLIENLHKLGYYNSIESIYKEGKK